MAALDDTRHNTAIEAHSASISLARDGAMNVVQKSETETAIWSGVRPALLRQKRRGLRRYIGPKRTLALLTLAALVAGTWFLRRQGVLDTAQLQSIVNSYPVNSPIVMILIYSLGVVSGLPTLPLNLAR